MMQVTGKQGGQVPLRELLAGYDNEVQESLSSALATTTGTDRVRALHNRLLPSVAVHDAVLDSVLCPLLENLSGGSSLAERMRQGCRERAELLRRFESLTKGVAARNVYAASGEEIEGILEGLERSFEAHIHDETDELGDVLSSATASVDPDVVAARMAIETRRAPTRIHRATSAHPGSALLDSVYRWRDRIADWVDTHHGWSEAEPRSPRTEQVEELEDEATKAPLTVGSLLSGYDATVDVLIDELRSAEGDLQKADVVHRLSAAITVHDSVLGGVLCPLVAAVPGGVGPAERLRQGCRHRAELLMAWKALSRGLPASDVFRLHHAEAEQIVESLIESFSSHEHEGSPEVVNLLERLPEKAYRHRTSPFADFMWPWHSDGPSVLALRMAMWARSSPTRPHPLFARYPSSRVLRSVYHFADHLSDSWRDTVLEGWLFPRLSARPFRDAGPSQQPRR